LRLAIYELALGGHTYYLRRTRDKLSISSVDDTNTDSGAFNLVRTCRQFNDEAKTLPVRLSTFVGDFGSVVTMFTGFEATDGPCEGMVCTIPWDLDWVGNNITSLIVKDEYVSIPGLPFVPEHTFSSSIVEVYQQLTSMSRMHFRIEYYHPIDGPAAPRTGFPGTDRLALEDMGSLGKQLGVLRSVVPMVKITMDLLEEESPHVFTTWQ
jgi:hypothetical protein